MDNVVMFTRARLAELAGVTQRRLYYWEQSDLIHPTVAGNARGEHRQVRLYGYRDALTVLILAELRKSVSLPHIRAIVAHLGQRNFAVPEIVFAIDGKRIVFQAPDGVWEDGQDLAQTVLHQVLDLRPLRARLDSATRRAPEEFGHTEKRRGVLGSKPVMAGTRVPVSAVESFMSHGASDAEILEAYPSLTEEDLEAVRALATA